MDGNNGHNLEAQEEEVCESCACCGEECALVVCESCGMPMNSPADHGGGDPDNPCCVHCCQPDGTLKSYEEMLAGMTAFMMKMRGLDEAAAEAAARDYMATMPAWSGR